MYANPLLIVQAMYSTFKVSVYYITRRWFLKIFIFVQAEIGFQSKKLNETVDT